MAKGGSMNKVHFEPGAPKKTRQGRSARTLLSATSRNGRKKKYRGQGTWLVPIVGKQVEEELLIFPNKKLKY